MERYRKSEELLKRAESVIPLGSQTFSKSKVQFAPGSSPLFLANGKGSRVWDVDGNEYIDFVNGLLPVVLGYQDPDVDAAVEEQLKKGVTFSLPTELEYLLAEELVEIIPCAEMVRFGKNGSDATSGAVRVARAYTGKDRIAACGYHGWQDWYIGSTTRNKGVPKAVSDLTHTFAYNDIGSLEKLFKENPGEFAAVIMEPMNIVEPANGFLESVKELAHKNGALLIFDEIITGFRFNLGGAQKLFGVTPDLATFGKSMGNGFPISCVVGKADIMREMEEIFFSFTFGGDALSLAASLAVLKKMKKEPVIETLWERGGQLAYGIGEAIKKYDLNSYISIHGKPCWSLFKFVDPESEKPNALKSLFLQELFARGILTIGSNNISYAHSKDDIAKTINAYNEVFEILSNSISNNKTGLLLNSEPLKPVFSVR